MKITEDKLKQVVRKVLSESDHVWLPATDSLLMLDKDKNVVVEVDERHHYDIHGNLRDKDITRQNEIIKHLGCQFVRIDYETGDANVY